MQKLATAHLETKFFEIEAASAPFLTTRLGVKVLPFVIAYLRGKELTRLVGFEFIGGDNFATKDLESYLVRFGALNRNNAQLGSAQQSILGFNQKCRDDDSDEDFDD